MTLQSILITTGTPPGTAGVGNILMKDCLDAIHPQQHQYCAIVPLTEKLRSEENTLVDQTFLRRFETGFRPMRGLLGEIAGHLAFRMRTVPLAKSIARNILSTNENKQFRILFAVLDSPITILLPRLLASRLKVPVASFVMDATEQISSHYYHDRFTTRFLRTEFDRVMSISQKIGVAGESMKLEYEKRYRIPCYILRQGAVTCKATEAKLSPADPEFFRIGFAGTLTAPDTFASLLKTLDERGWILHGKKVILRIIGARFELRSNTPQHIEYFGWRSREETNKLLSECDALYLPQPFAESLRPLAEQSFPNKFITYVGASRPIFVHAPAYASLASFLRTYRCGIHCDRLESTSIAEGFLRFIQDPKWVSESILECQRSVREELNFEALRKNCRQLLDVPND